MEGSHSRATHELFDRPELIDELKTYVAGLRLTPPATFAADTVSLYRFVHPTWSGPRWETMRWDYLRNWRLL